MPKASALEKATQPTDEVQADYTKGSVARLVGKLEEQVVSGEITREQAFGRFCTDVTIVRQDELHGTLVLTSSLDQNPQA